MEKSFLMRFDSVSCEHDGIKARGLKFDIKEGGMTGVLSAYPDIIARLITGETVPAGGNIILAGVNVTDRNLNERRAARMPTSLPDRDINRLLKCALDTKNTPPNVYEVREDELQDRLKALKSQLKSEPGKQAEIREQMRKTQTEITALGFRIKRRRTELELNLKATKTLLASVKKTAPDFVDALERKLFSAQYELCAYTHKAMPSQMVERRIAELKQLFFIADDTTDTELSFICAYANAPLIIVCTESDGFDAAELRRLCSEHNVTVCYAAGKDSDAEFDYSVDILDARFIRG